MFTWNSIQDRSLWSSIAYRRDIFLSIAIGYAMEWIFANGYRRFDIFADRGGKRAVLL